MTCNGLDSKSLLLSNLSKVATCYYTKGPHYLGGEVWVASGEAGHNPNVTGSYQAQGSSFLHYIPVKEQSEIINKDLLQKGRQEQQKKRKDTHTASSLEQYSSITGLWILLRAMCDLELGSPSTASRVTTLCRSQRTKLQQNTIK